MEYISSNKNVIVSVVVPVYNQEKYVRETIMSIIKQKCSFKYEIIVVDDCSHDNSYEVCSMIAKEYPDLVRNYKNEHNLGILGNQFLSLYPKCAGEYIACCAGDDVWVDDYKLQKQVDYLQKHIDCSCVHTGYIKKYEETRMTESYSSWLSPLLEGHGKRMAIEVIKENFTSFPVASSMMYRRKVLETFSNYIEEAIKDPFARGEAMILFPIFALTGKYAYLSEPMVSYRVREKSASHFVDNKLKEKFDIFYLFQKLNTTRLLRLGSCIRLYLNFKTVKYFLCYAKESSKSDLLNYLSQYRNNSTFNFYPGICMIIRLGLLLKK